MECKKYFYYISCSHFKKCCNLTHKEYIKKYPNIELLSKERNKKISNTLKGRKLSEQRCKNMSIGRKGMKFSDKHKQNMSITKKKLYENGYINPKKGKKLSKETKQKMKDNHADVSGENNPMFGRKHSEESCKKRRISRIKEIEYKNGYIFPNYSINACKFFEYLNKEFNLKGLHALNGGEFYIKDLGYFLDYYESDLNLVIEWDEKSHKYKKKKDKIREDEIIKYLKCTFIRIKE